MILPLVCTIILNLNPYFVAYHYYIINPVFIIIIFPSTPSQLLYLILVSVLIQPLPPSCIVFHSCFSFCFLWYMHCGTPGPFPMYLAHPRPPGPFPVHLVRPSGWITFTLLTHVFIVIQVTSSSLYTLLHLTIRLGALVCVH